MKMQVSPAWKFIAVAVLIKLFLFSSLVIHAPQNRFMNDSNDYLEIAKTLSSQYTFAKVSSDGALSYDLFRTPGYPFFLAILLSLVKIPINGVIFIQILFTLLVALITYKAACQVDLKIGFLSAIIILYDPVISIFSFMIMTEALFFLLISLFMLTFVMYLKNNKVNLVMVSALLLAIATYVRPISYYLGIAITVFIIYANFRLKNIKKAVLHALIFLVLIYSCLGIWEHRNYRRTGQRVFSSVIQGVPKAFGLSKIFSKNHNSLSQKEQPVIYFLKTTSRCLLSLMTRPGSFKYFKSTFLSDIGKALSYIWMSFWMFGFIIGTVKIRTNIYYQFIFLVILYFIFTSIGGIALEVGERFRVPMMPFIAIISAFGWVKIKDYLT